jgi:putative chitinase
MTLTDQQLVAIMPRVNAAHWLGPLSTAMARFAIVTPARAAAFLAQVAHESGECRRLVENLNYSAQGLERTWPKRFPSTVIATEFARQPERIANRVYAGRMGNGDEASGDGWKFRGRGLLQTTGRSNYRATGIALQVGLEANPEQLEQPGLAALAAAYFWDSRGCNALADSEPGDNDDEDFVRITKIINGGTNGLKERREYWARARQALAA